MILATRKEAIPFRVRDYFAYLKKKGEHMRKIGAFLPIGRKRVSNQLTKVRKELGKVKKDTLTYGEFAAYVGTTAEDLHNFIRG